MAILHVVTEESPLYRVEDQKLVTTDRHVRQGETLVEPPKHSQVEPRLQE